jgi:hypothetical protein
MEKGLSFDDFDLVCKDSSLSKSDIIELLKKRILCFKNERMFDKGDGRGYGFKSLLEENKTDFLSNHDHYLDRAMLEIGFYSSMELIISGLFSNKRIDLCEFKDLIKELEFIKIAIEDIVLNGYKK